jgi:hypothetical protein
MIRGIPANDIQGAIKVADDSVEGLEINSGFLRVGGFQPAAAIREFLPFAHYGESRCN